MLCNCAVVTMDETCAEIILHKQPSALAVLTPIVIFKHRLLWIICLFQ